ncbi:MAG: flagellar hook protein FlgE [Fimbriimonadaceae bacterium]|nr:flagellar hook protein FlgE [Fimbriimonadaceae bacterium]
MLAGVASIRAQQTRMNAIGNNLANVNTTAFKSSRVTFQDMLAQTVRGATAPNSNLGGMNPIQIGLGVLTAGTDTNNEQGSLNGTSRVTDLAIQGNGFFLVSNGGRVAYTRDGSFDLDARGDLVHRATGERVLGWTADAATGVIDVNAPIGPSSSIRVPMGQRTAVQATTNVNWTGNLDSRVFVEPGIQETQAVVRVYDSLGSSHDITITYTESATPNQWDWSVAGANGTVAVGSGSITFDPNTGSVIGGGVGTMTVQPPGSTGISPFDVDLNFSSLSQLSTEMQIQASSQNGFAPGSLTSFTISADGVITGLFTNGLTRPIGQISMAIFPNPSGMERMGANLWRDTNNSGVPVYGQPRANGRGSINSGFLEQSNVDIGNEFTELIVTQRGFQSNTRVVTTVDEMLQDLINMKR